MDKLVMLIINPSTDYTDVAVFWEEEQQFSTCIYHSHEELAKQGTLVMQKELRIAAVKQTLQEQAIALDSITAVVGPCGSLQGVESAVYPIIGYIIDELIKPSAANHAPALGGLMAYELGNQLNVTSYVVDPLTVDEQAQFAKLSGLPGIERRSLFHALNHKAIARRYAAELGIEYENSRLIVAHLGMTITVAAHLYGRVIDVNNALAGEGPFSPESSGSLPPLDIVRMCYSNDYTEQEMVEKITRGGGLTGYLGTNNLMRIQRMILDGDDFATLVLDAMAYQISKEICGMLAALEGRADIILLTGGMAGSKWLVSAIKQRIVEIAPVKAYPGNEEVNAMAAKTWRAIRKREGMGMY